MKTAITVLAIVIALAFAHDAMARSSSSDRPRIGHHSGTNGPSRAGWGGTLRLPLRV
jgi:hypothetical protein